MGQMTPMMVQYLKTKEAYKDCILFYRLGDFYEMFYDDACLVSKELELVLTGKDCGMEERAPMCGIPYHAAEGYISKLVSRGYKVAICEQVEDPRTAKGLVKREVVRIVTPGTTMIAGAIDENRNNYLMCVVHAADMFGIAVCDSTTGDFYTTQVPELRQVMDELVKFDPSELLVTEAVLLSGLDVDRLKAQTSVAVTILDGVAPDETYCGELLMRHYAAYSLAALGLDEMPIAVISAGTLMQYLEDTQKRTLSHLTELSVYHVTGTMVLDAATRRNLELVETMREKRKTGSLLGVLDRTKTAMGARMLRSYLEQPLCSGRAITARQMAVGALKNDSINREELREYLTPIYDMERLIGRISYESANARDLIALRNSLRMLPHIRSILKSFEAPLLKSLYDEIDPLEDVCGWIEDMIEEDPPMTIKEGGIIRKGCSEDVDRLRNAKTEGKEWLTRLEEQERNSTGIKNLKIRYNKVFGYYLEVTNSFKDLVPEHYVRKQTLTGSERYIIPELKELEDTILGAEDKLYALEYQLFSELRTRIAGEVQRVRKSAKAVATLDALCSLAYVAERNHYCCPAMNDNGIINIKEGRHPVVERMMKDELFIPNDTYLDQEEHRLSIITGPNMAGKSTYMRQTALIVLMAHVGSFVPAASAEISIVDRIFTRVGASDDLAGGQSTFMVEMTEVANIVRNATSRSLIILDEIGRGTSTYDGLSIAWAVAEYISNPKKIGAKTLFATHYHELTELEGKVPGVNNYCIAVKEEGEKIVFLRKIVKGGADRSYGIQVAALAGVPKEITRRASEIVNGLSDCDIALRVEELLEQQNIGKTVHCQERSDPDQMSFFDTVNDTSISDEILGMDISRMTPLEALQKLDALQKKLINRW